MYTCILMSTYNPWIQSSQEAWYLVDTLPIIHFTRCLHRVITWRNFFSILLHDLINKVVHLQIYEIDFKTPERSYCLEKVCFLKMSMKKESSMKWVIDITHLSLHQLKKAWIFELYNANLNIAIARTSNSIIRSFGCSSSW